MTKKQPSVAVALWGREHVEMDLDDEGPKNDAQLVEYERSAVTAMAQMLPLWYNEVGLSGILSSMFELIKQVDAAAQDIEGDDEEMRKQRFVAAQHIRLTAMLSRKEVQEAVEMLGEKLGA